MAQESGRLFRARVWEAFKRVKANQGAAGVDAQSIAEFEVDLSNNLYKRAPCPPPIAPLSV